MSSGFAERVVDLTFARTTAKAASSFGRFPHANFKQPSFRILAARCVRGLPAPRGVARGWSGGRRQGCCVRHPLEADQWTHLARQGEPGAPKARRSASQRSTNHRAVDRPGAPVRPALALCRREDRFWRRKRPASNRTRAIIRSTLGDGDKECKKIFANVYSIVGWAKAHFAPCPPSITPPSSFEGRGTSTSV